MTTALTAGVLASCTPAPSDRPPVVSGTPIVGATLSTTHGTWHFEPTGFRVLWRTCDAATRRGCVQVGEGSTYQPTAGDVGRLVQSVVIARNGAGETSQGSVPVGPVAPAPGRPQLGAVLINDDAPGTTDPLVTLTFPHDPDAAPDEVRVADGTDPSGAEWQAFVGTMPWTLAPSAAGTATVAVQFRTDGVESATFTDDIVVDPDGPIVTLAPLDLVVGGGGGIVEITTVGATSASIAVTPSGGATTTHAMSPAPEALAETSSTLGRYTWTIAPGLDRSFEFTVTVTNGDETATAPSDGRYQATFALDPSSTRSSIDVTSRMRIPGDRAHRTDTWSGISDPVTGSTRVRGTTVLGSFVVEANSTGRTVLRDADRQVAVELPSAPTDVPELVVTSVTPLPAAPGRRSWQVVGGVPTGSLLGVPAEGPDGLAPARFVITTDRRGEIRAMESAIGDPDELWNTRSVLTRAPGAPAVDVALPPTSATITPEAWGELVIADLFPPVAGGVRASGSPSSTSSISGACATAMVSVAAGIGIMVSRLGLVVLVPGAWTFGAILSVIGVFGGIALAIGGIMYGLAQILGCFDPPPPPPPGPKGESKGEPHVFSFDRVGFEFHAEGEFVFTRSRSDAFEVQMRTLQWTVEDGGAVVGRRVSFNDGIAVRTPAGDVVEMLADRTLVNGSPISVGERIPLSGGAIAEYDVVVLGDGTRVEALPMWITRQLTVTPAAARAGDLVGVAGDADGDQTNELVSRDGATQVDIAEWFDSDAPRQVLYGVVAPSWVPPSGERLFSDPLRAYVPPLDPVNWADLDAAAVEWARALCESRGWTPANGLAACIFDVVVTGRPEFAGPEAQTDSWSTAMLTPESPGPNSLPDDVDPWARNAWGLAGGPGSVHAVTCPAGGEAFVIWGTDVYAAESSICTAAVHVGLIAFAEGGTVNVELTGPVEELFASTHHGVTSEAWGPWGSNFRFPDAPPLGADPALIDWARGGNFYSGRDTDTFTRTCPPGGDPHGLWGTDVYTSDSSICTAAVHAGLITFAAGGSVTFRLVAGAEEYVGTSRNGVESQSWGAWYESMVLLG